ncbi:hypothetical protein LTR99_009617 [Exophiala xenobiotica]|uniref:Xylanolytic transcriptional activator regulatory domain-containing protein n=1 Tax=Vermiconidia calcicola TaxID=1690605 RepID=A0AAV9PX49_9PEZI|nr:hypothetical protein H2202_005032 [Exophiala xenobiotica]KAK5530455.1 hypothetical protein LTR25_009033 [Vermiconidia calcicola]KAK5539104.1 hypothetical protein LTR23_006918 [Chaetothyriales sp. CCFEE 6169]KAK5192629.1 hypothetical protein LTR92_007804 [Exophiala xenobiotica]KAK5205486.1 hypothetical protein LTR41_008940 [Exophiala xenobiotica]
MRDQNAYNNARPSPRAATQEPRDGSVGDMLEASASNEPEIQPPASVRPALQASPSSTDLSQHRNVLVHTLVQSETGITIHGPASAFHVPPSLRAATSLPSIPADSPVSVRSQQQTNDNARRELFAYSALEFQKEYTYMAERKIDLDGLDWETADHLFQLHWNHHHLGFLLTYRPAIMHSLATGGPHCNKLLLNAIYYTAALQSSRPNMRDDPAHPEYLGTKFFHRVQSLLASELQTSSTATIAALVSMGSSCVSNGRQTIGWLYAGIAYQMVVDLGLHVDPEKVQMSSLVPSQPPVPMTAVDLEIQRRYTWGAYINDRFQSLYFGRPPSLRMIEGVETSQTLLDDYEELEIWKPYVDPASSEPVPNFVPQPARAVSTFQALVKLAEITDQIIERFYTPKSARMSTEAAHCEVLRLQQRLDLWAEELPVHLRYEPGQLPVPPPIRFNLHTTFSLLHILLHRPFLREGHLEALSADESTRQSICVSAAMRICNLAKIYRETFTLRRATYLFSYAVFSAAAVLPMHSSPDSDPTQRMEIVVFFWNALKELQNGANFGLRKPIRIIGGMFERAGIDLSALPTMDKRRDNHHHHNTRAHSQDGTRNASDPSANTNPQNLPLLPDSGLDMLDNETFKDFYNDLSFENIDWPAFVDVDTGHENDELLYGLFRAGNGTEDGLASRAHSPSWYMSSG